MTSLVYAVIHRLWLTSPSRPLATIQFILHQVGCLGMLLMLVMVLRTDRMQA